MIFCFQTVCKGIYQQITLIVASSKERKKITKLLIPPPIWRPDQRLKIFPLSRAAYPFGDRKRLNGYFGK